MAKTKTPKKTVQVNNPAYKGATPEMVARALLRPVRKDRPKPGATNKKGDPKVA